MTKSRFNLRKVATIVACLAVTTMFASCDGKNGDDDKNGNSPTGTINKELVGTWLGALGGVNYFYEFKADGTYMFRTYRPSSSPTISSSTLTRGVWRESKEVIYLTDVYLVAWANSSTPPENLDWKKGSNDTRNIKILEEAYSAYYERVIREMIVYDFFGTDDTNKKYYLTIMQDNLPSWAFPK